MPTAKEITAAQTARGGWTKAQLAEWGVPWPPPKGWRKRLPSVEKMLHHAQIPVDAAHAKCMSVVMQTFTEVIAAFGGPSVFARAIDVPVPTAQSMSTRNAIAPRHWDAVAAAAKRKKISGVTRKALAAIAANKSSG